MVAAMMVMMIIFMESHSVVGMWSSSINHMVVILLSILLGKSLILSRYLNILFKWLGGLWLRY